MPVGIADALVLLEADELDKAIDILRPEVLVLGNEFKTTLKYKPLWYNNANKVELFNFMQANFTTPQRTCL